MDLNNRKMTNLPPSPVYELCPPGVGTMGGFGGVMEIGLQVLFNLYF